MRAGNAPSTPIDLLQGEFAPRAGHLSATRIPRAAFALAALIAILQLAFLGIDTWRLERERAALELKRESVFRSAFPDARTVVDPDLQMARNLSELRRARGLAGDDDFLAQLSRAGREAVPVKSIEYAGGNLQVKR